MGNGIQPYAAAFKVQFKNQLAYRTDIILDMILTMLSSLIFVFVWVAAYSFSGTTSLDGLSLTLMIAYFVMVGAIRQITGWPQIINNMEDDIKQGGIARFMIRPMSYTMQLFLEALPVNILFFVFGSIPVIVLVIVFGHFVVSYQLIAIFVVEMLIAYFMINLIGFMIGSMAVYLSSVWGIANGVAEVFSIAGGAIVPLAFLSQGVANTLMLTPFPFMYYIPAGTLLGIIPMSTALQSVAVGIAWVAVLAVLAHFVWGRVKRDINAVGG
jgi:ABC-2 type transport system permease protein